jgi:hypothetical protein
LKGLSFVVRIEVRQERRDIETLDRKRICDIRLIDLEYSGGIERRLKMLKQQR